MEECRQLAPLRLTWINACETQLQELQRHLSRNLPRNEQDEYVVQQLIFTDIRVTCEPSLPQNIHELHDMKLQGRYFLQIVDVCNVSAGTKQRHDDSKTRTLKICFTDGYTLAYAIEHIRIDALSVNTPRGTKIIIENVDVRHGLILLTSVIVLGNSGNPELEEIGNTSTGNIPQEDSTRRELNPTIAHESLHSSRIEEPSMTRSNETPSTREQEMPSEEELRAIFDADLSEEERNTDPAIRHLFYSTSTTQSIIPPSSRERRATKELNPIREPVVNASLPFSYLSHVQNTTEAITIKAFVRSVKSFDYLQGHYDLKIQVEDGTRALLVVVAPELVEKLMGVPCTVFIHAMETDLPRGMQLAQKMQSDLSVMEGIMTIQYQRHDTTKLPCLKTCTDLSNEEYLKLLQRVSY